MKWQLSNEAKRDLVEIYAYSIATFGEHVADDYQSTIERALRRLSERPKTGRPATQLGDGLRVHPVRSHILIYRPSHEGILVLRIRHQSEDWLAESDSD